MKTVKFIVAALAITLGFLAGIVLMMLAVAGGESIGLSEPVLWAALLMGMTIVGKQVLDSKITARRVTALEAEKADLRESWKSADRRAAMWQDAFDSIDEELEQRTAEVVFWKRHAQDLQASISEQTAALVAVADELGGQQP